MAVEAALQRDIPARWWRFAPTSLRRMSAIMLPKIDLSEIADQLQRAGEEIQRIHDDTGARLEPAPQVALRGLEGLLDRLRASDTDDPAAAAERLRAATGSEPNALLEHGLALLGQVAEAGVLLGLEQQAQAVEIQAVPLSCWLLRRGAELARPEPVVHALATLANRLSDPDDLGELHGLMNEIAEGISPDRILGMDPENPTDPWLILLINRGIVATRSHQPALMTQAFDAIVAEIPEHAPHFFREGMGQMELLDYPPQVRELMRQYYDRWCGGQRLH